MYKKVACIILVILGSYHLNVHSMKRPLEDVPPREDESVARIMETGLVLTRIHDINKDCCKRVFDYVIGKKLREAIDNLCPEQVIIHANLTSVNAHIPGTGTTLNHLSNLCNKQEKKFRRPSALKIFEIYTIVFPLANPDLVTEQHRRDLLEIITRHRLQETRAQEVKDVLHYVNIQIDTLPTT
jgi:hypothetical protein